MIKVSDGQGSNIVSEGLTVDINYFVGEPKVKTASSDKCVTCTASGRIIIGILVVEGLIVALLVIHFCCNVFCLTQSIKRYVCRPTRNVNQ